MNLDTSDQNAKQRILEAASVEFAERGFDGARVDSIAKRAGVNKALIYYYYKNKEELLSLLFQETKDAVFALLKSPAIMSTDYSSEESLKALLYMFLDLLEARQNVIRVMLMEGAKRTPINDLIFTILGQVMDGMFAMAGESGLLLEQDRQTAMINEFFTGIMPLLDYVAYHEIWMEKFSIDESTLRARFVTAFLGTHFAYTIKPDMEGKTS